MASFQTLSGQENDGNKALGTRVLTATSYPLQRRISKNIEAIKHVPIMGFEDTVHSARKFTVESSPIFIESMKDKVVMTDYTHTIRIYESNGKRCKRIYAESPTSILSGLAFNESNNSLFVCDAIGHGEARVQIFDTAEDITPVVYLGQGLFEAPHGICVTNDHKIIVSDVEKKEVYIIQEDGYNAICFGEKGKRGGQFFFPHDVVYDKEHKRIIVSDTHNHRIQAFTAAGEFIKAVEFDEEGNRFFHYPTGLALDPLGNLFVCHNDTLSILDEDLRLYSTLSTADMGLGKATSVVALPYERLCVSSCEMSCFMIF